MDPHPAALHPAPPGHLALGELVDGGGERVAHLLIGEGALQVEGDVFVFQPVGKEPFGGYAAREQPPDFVDHPFLQAGVQPRIDACVAGVTVHQGPDEKGLPRVPVAPGRLLAGGAERGAAGEIVAARDSIDIQTGTAAEYGHGAAAADVGVGAEEVLLVLPDIVLLSVVGGFTSEEVGRMVGLRPGSVRSRLSRSLKKMRECLEDES